MIPATRAASNADQAKTPDTSDNSHKEAFPFLSLPAELRNRVYEYLMPTPVKGRICRRKGREIIETEDPSTETPDVEEFDGNEAHLVVVWDTDLGTGESWGNSGALTMRQTCRHIQGEITCMFSVLHLWVSTLTLLDLRQAWCRGAMSDRVRIRQRVPTTEDGGPTSFIRLPWDHADVLRIAILENNKATELPNITYIQLAAEMMNVIVTSINSENVDQRSKVPVLQLMVDEFPNAIEFLRQMECLIRVYWPEDMEKHIERFRFLQQVVTGNKRTLRIITFESQYTRLSAMLLLEAPSADFFTQGISDSGGSSRFGWQIERVRYVSL